MEAVSLYNGIDDGNHHDNDDEDEDVNDCLVLSFNSMFDPSYKPNGKWQIYKNIEVQKVHNISNKSLDQGLGCFKYTKS